MGLNTATKEGSGRRRRSSQSGAGSSSCSSTRESSRKRLQSGVSPSNSKIPKRISRVRKALNFDNEVVPRREIRSSDRHERFAFPSAVETIKKPEAEAEMETSRIPPIAHFWTNPPPLESSGVQLSFDLQCSSGPQPQRRSERLILKGLTSFEPILERDSNSGTDPSLLPPPSTQNLFPPPFTGYKFPSTTGAPSVHSDYGSSSEMSFNSLRKRKQNISSDIPKKTQRSLHDLSPGYVSDIDEGIGSQEIHEQPNTWDSDDDGAARLSSNIVVNVSREWDEVVQDEGSDSLHSFASSYMDISNLSAVADVNVKWLSFEGIHVVIPLEGYEIPSDYRPKPPPSPPAFMKHLVQEDMSPSSSAYDTRKKTRFKPRPIPPSPFQIHTFPEKSVRESFRRKGLRLLTASPVISLEPKSTKFCELYPAIVSIPLAVVPALGDEIYCLYAENPNVEEEFGSETDPCLVWNILHDVKISLEGGRLTFETYEFCSFVVVVREKAIGSQKQIRARIGGKLLIPEVPGVEVSFSKGSVLQDITARSKIFLDAETNIPDFISDGKLTGREESSFTPATPIIMLEPHGVDFGPDLVTIQLPIPDYDKIIELYGPLARLSILQSRTTENEPTCWEILDVDFEITKVKLHGHQHHPITVISFKVSHFSFFQVVWDLISSSLYEGNPYAHLLLIFLSFRISMHFTLNL